MPITRILAVLALLMLPAPLLAQTTPLIIDRNRADRDPVPVPVPKPQAPVRAPDTQVATPSVMPFTLHEVRVQGTSVAPTMLAEATQPFIGKTIDRDGIARIAEAVARAYENSDIALYTVAAPNQDFAGGVLRLTVTEGYIQSVDLTGDTDGDLTLLHSYTERLTAERPLKRRTLQRYISLIRDLPGLTSDIQLRRSGAPGAVAMSIGLVQRKLLIGVSVNNAGSEILGRTQFQFDATLYNLLREGEQTRFTFGAPTDVERYQYYGVSHAEPLDADGTLLQLSAGLLRTKPKGLALEGEASTLQLLLSHPFIRSYDENLYLSGGIDGLNSENAVLGQSIANERVRALRAAAAYTKTNPKSVLGLGATLSFGLDALGAREAGLFGGDSDFVKVNAQVGYDRALGTHWVARLRAAGQYAASRLPASELSSLGGSDYGRAFAAASVTGDSSLAGSAELGWVPELGSEFLKGSELYVFADGARAWYRARIVPAIRSDIASAGLGTRIAIAQKAVLQLEAANVLDAPSLVAREGTWHFSFAVRSAF